MRSSAGVAALAAAALVLGGIDAVVLIDRTNDQPPLETPTPSPGATASERPSEAPSSDDPRESIDEQLARVAAAVSEIRDLPFEEVPEATYLSLEELAERAGALLDEYTAEDADVDERLLVALGAIPPETDLRALLRTALSEGVAGFYDPKTGEMVVGNRNEGERLGPLDEITLAHELEHALADQKLGLPFGDEDPPEGHEDEAYAAQSLVEGDATATMIEYAETELSVLDQAQLLVDQAELQEQLNEATPLPHFLERSLLFPYQEGAIFVEELRRNGGWAAVDAAYDAPPLSTLQILEPQRYLDGTGVAEPVRPPAALAAPWEQLATLQVGAADLLFLFEAPGGRPEQSLDAPLAAATTWRGGTVQVWASGETSAVGFVVRGEVGLCDAMAAWYAAAFGSGQSDGSRTTFDGAQQDAVLTCVGDEVRIGIGPDLVTAELLAS